MDSDFTRIKAPPQVVQYPTVRLTVTKGPDAGATLDAASTSVRIGTSPENDLVLTDDTVSRRHCEVTPGETGVRVLDSGSRNGIVVNNALIREAFFSAPLTLELGQSTISVVPLAETTKREQVTDERFGDLLGKSAKMRELFADLERVAGTDLSLLIQGETGTGKELVAHAVHSASPRADGPFVVFDCGGVVPTLAESELFGHERGAFTGAVSQRAGVFEQANGGTIFIDELGELPKDLQPRLLRVLEKREVRRVGGTKPIAVDVRLISATHRNLRAEVKRGEFREDLYFRVAGAQVYVPPLRDRLEDLTLLAAAFLANCRPPHSPSDVPPHIWDMFRAYRWPGNVRELKNAIQRVLVTPDRPLGWDAQPDDELGATPSTPPPRAPQDLLPLRVARRDAADAFEKDYLVSVLDKSGGSITRAAELAEVSRQVIHRLITKHGL